MGLREIYGLCMYRSPESGLYYVIANSAVDGGVEQWELFDAGDGTVDARLARSFKMESQTEGCVADDELGVLYIGEEDTGVWKFGAEPDDGDAHTLVDSTESGNLVADVEGLALYYGADGSGYLIVSSQGSSEFVVYERNGDNAYIGRFQIREGDYTDAVSGTDGIDVSNASLGPTFADGLFVAQDDRRINPDGYQNFKLVSWGAIAEALGLEVDTSYDPRAVE